MSIGVSMKPMVSSMPSAWKVARVRSRKLRARPDPKVVQAAVLAVVH